MEGWFGKQFKYLNRHIYEEITGGNEVENKIIRSDVIESICERQLCDNEDIFRI